MSRIRFLVRGILAYYRLMANLYLAFNKPFRAASTIEKAIRLSRRDPNLYFSLSNAYAAAYDWRRATEALRNAVALNPNNLKYRFALGVSLMSCGHFTDAVPQFEFIIANGANDSGEYLSANCTAMLGQCYLVFGNFDKAEELLRSAQEVSPWNLDACKGTIDLYQLTNRFQQIPVFLEKYIRNYPHLYPPYIWMANYIHYLAYNPKDALKWYQEAIELMRNDETRKYCEEFVSSHDMQETLFDCCIEALIKIWRQERCIDTY